MLVRPWRIHRERIVARLHSSGAPRVSLLVAGAGFGKSIALRTIFGAARDVAFYRVPADTATLLAFLRGLTDALEADVPGAHLSFAIAYERAIQCLHRPFAPCEGIGVQFLDRCANRRRR